MTDPQRIANPVKAAQNLPRGAAIIYRHYGADNAFDTAQKLRQVTFERDQQFLIGHDPKLALRTGADGVHFRRDEGIVAPTLWRTRCPDWVISMAGLKAEQNYSGDLNILDGLLISSIFYSKSPSAGNPIGVENLKSICKNLDVPIFALGGVSNRTATSLIGSGAAGLAGIDGLLL